MGRKPKDPADKWVKINIYVPQESPAAYAEAAQLAKAPNTSAWMRAACDMRMDAESQDRARLARKAVGP